MTKSEQAISKFMEGYNCAQSVFFSFCDDLKIEKDKALKMACGFGAGMGRKEEVCGAARRCQKMPTWYIHCQF